MAIVGIDLGKNSFRALELERRKEGLVVTHIGTYESPKINFDSENKEDLDSYAAALKEFISESGFTSPFVSVGLDEKYIYMRTIKLPQMNDRDLENAVNFEAEQYIPLPLSEVKVSHQRLDVDYADKAKTNVQIVAAKKSILEKYIEVVKKAHLIPKAIEPFTIALGRALGDSQENPAGSLILDMGYSRTIVIIVYGGFVRFTRSIPVGGDVMTRALQQALSLDYSQAEEYKKVYGLDKSQVEGKVYEVLEPQIGAVISEVQRASIFFTNQQSNANIKRVILTGGTSQMPGLLLHLASTLDFEVEMANPFKDIQIDQKIKERNPKFSEQEGPVYSAALGLAIKEV
ncbi:MAG: type IV pilus assembly protein PilM [Patescibacteria group bacterium]